MPKTTTKRIRITVTPQRGQWAVKQPGIRTETSGTKAACVAVATGRARDLWAGGRLAQVVIHRADGRIQEERTYGRDPVRHRG
jgi:hypothetical protein